MEVLNYTASIEATEKASLSQWMIFIICFAGNIFGGNVSTLMSVYLPAVVNDLSVNTSQAQMADVSAWINSLYIFGWTFGGIISGVLGDKFGRAKCTGYSIGLCGLFTLCTAIAPSWPVVVVTRFMTGFSVGGILVTSAIYLTEIWPKSSRSIVVGILSIGFPIGIFSAGLTEFFVTHWRQAFLSGVGPIVLSILSIWIFKESASWKKVDSDDSQKIKLFSSGVQRSNLISGSIIFGTMLIGLWAIFSWLPTWIQSLTSSDARAARGVSMMMLGGGGLLGGFLSGYVSNIIGMRRLMIICFAGCFVMCLFLFGFNSSLSIIVYMEIACLAIFFGSSQGTLSVFIPLLFPAVIRATATGLCFNIGRVFTGVVVFFVGWLVIALGGYSHALLIFSTIFLVGLLTLLFVDKGDKNN